MWILTTKLQVKKSPIGLHTFLASFNFGGKLAVSITILYFKYHQFSKLRQGPPCLTFHKFILALLDRFELSFASVRKLTTEPVAAVTFFATVEVMVRSRRFELLVYHSSCFVDNGFTDHR
jgi:hypothetical protein